MARVKFCRWKCGGPTANRTGICNNCWKASVDRHRQIDAGVIAYVPPQDRPGHRLYKRRRVKRTAEQEASLTRVNTDKSAITAKEMPRRGAFVVRVCPYP